MSYFRNLGNKYPNTMKVTLSSRLDVSGFTTQSPTVTSAKSDIKIAGQIFPEKGDLDFALILQPKLGTFDMNGYHKSADPMDVDVSLTRDTESFGTFSAYLDNIDQSNMAPRVSWTKTQEDFGKLDVTFAKKGNTSVLPKRAPLQSDILQFTVAPNFKVGAFKTKWSYDTNEAKTTPKLAVAGRVAGVTINADAKYDTAASKLKGKVVGQKKLNDDVTVTAEMGFTKTGLLTVGYTGSLGMLDNVGMLDAVNVELPIKDMSPDLGGTKVKLLYSSVLGQF